MDWLMKHKGWVCAGGAILLCVLVGIGLWFGHRERVTLPNDSIVVDVNTEIDRDLSTYLHGMRQPELASADWDALNMEQVGIYEVAILYKDQSYVLHVDVRDRKKPTLEIDRKEFSFPLHESSEAINVELNSHITIKDNYDMEFAPISIVKEMPTEPQTISYPFSVKDSSGNESDVVEVTITYIVEEPPVSNRNDNTSPSSPSSEVPTESPSSSVPSDQPSNPPVQNVEEFKPVAPAGAIEGYFGSRDEADSWIASYADDPNSEWYCAVGFMRRLPDGRWWAYIKKP